jgi:hypothetical protein
MLYGSSKARTVVNVGNREKEETERFIKSVTPAKVAMSITQLMFSSPDKIQDKKPQVKAPTMLALCSDG